MSVYFSPPDSFSPKVTAVGCWCDHKNTFLLMKRHSTSPQGNTWGVPGGKLEQGETPEQCVLREVKEETGIELELEKLNFKGTVYIRLPTLDYTFHLFSAEFEELPPQVSLNKEHTEYRWVTLQQALTLPLIRGAAECFQFIYTVQP
jgi:8-oxo-dGTP diphosphatase